MNSLMLFVLGLVALGFGAEVLVRGASRLALSLGVPPLVVGLTIVAMGTSAPEVAVSVGAVSSGVTDLAVGNVVGSNIFNVLVILGLSALFAPLSVHIQIIRQEVPIMIAASVLLTVMVLDGRIARWEAGLLTVLMVGYNLLLIRQARRGSKANQDEFEHALEHRQGRAAGWRHHWGLQVAMILGGLALLVVGANWLVDSATTFARAMGVSDLVIGLTVVAAGTSLPEVAASLAATLRGERDIAVGNVIGSNLFNILGCLGLSGLIPADGLLVAPAVMNFDIWVMLAVAFACLPIFLTGREVARWEGALLLAYYVAYTTYLILAAQQHALLTDFRSAMLYFAVPLTLVTLAVSFLRHRRAT